MNNLTGYHDKIAEFMTELVHHGWGELNFKVIALKDNKVKITISCGKSFVYIVQNDFKFNSEDVL